jgi:hypothetical protein
MGDKPDGSNNLYIKNIKILSPDIMHILIKSTIIIPTITAMAILLTMVGCNREIVIKSNHINQYSSTYKEDQFSSMIRSYCKLRDATTNQSNAPATITKQQNYIQETIRLSISEIRFTDDAAAKAFYQRRLEDRAAFWKYLSADWDIIQINQISAFLKSLTSTNISTLSKTNVEECKVSTDEKFFLLFEMRKYIIDEGVKEKPKAGKQTNRINGKDVYNATFALLLIQGL